MKFRLTNKSLNCARQRSLVTSCLLVGALSGPLGSAGCGGNVSMATPPPTMTTPPGSVGTPTTQPTPYNPPYPPLAPQVQRGTSGTLTTPHVIPVFFSGDKLETQLNTFVQAYITRSAAWQVLGEYGIGLGTVAAATVLTQTLSASMTDAEVQTFINARVQDGSITPTAQSVVLMFLPASVVINNSGQLSCQDFAGYHGSALLANGSHLAYAIIPRCAMEPVTGLTFAISHELAEAATDPYLASYNDLNDPYALWVLNLSGGEIGDLCQNLADAAAAEAGIGVVSRLWSNAAIAAFNNPCVPAAAGPAFFSIPMHTQLQTVQLNTTLRSVEQIPVAAGQSTTVAVRLLSTTKPSPTWSVSALEVPLPAASGGRSATALTFSWVEAPGQASAAGSDGATLHLKITANPSGPIGYTTFRLISIGPTAAGGKTETDWPGLVLVTK